MEDLSELIDAINHLSEVVGNNENTYIPMVVSTVLTTVGSIMAVLIFEAIKNSYIKPLEEFERLRNRVNSTLSLYACYYANQIDLASSNEKKIKRYNSASDAIRMISVELNAFADGTKRKKIKGIKVSNISDAARELMGLSNNLFTPYNCPEMTENEQNRERAGKIRYLLGVIKKSSS